MRTKDVSIRRQLIHLIMVTSSLVLMLTMIAFVLYEWAALRRSLSERIGTLGRVVADNCAAPLAFANKGDAQE